MPLCGPSCGCAIQSDTLNLSGSGSAGDPWQIEYAGAPAVTSATRPSPATAGDMIYETDTRRVLLFDGVNWVIQSGSLPRAIWRSGGALSVAQNTITSVPLGDVSVVSVISDPDGFRSGGDDFYTIPADLGGLYFIEFYARWEPSVNNGRRYQTIQIANNAGGAVGHDARMDRMAPSSVVDFAATVTETALVVPGAQVEARVYQTAAVTLEVIQWEYRIRMIEHRPEL